MQNIWTISLSLFAVAALATGCEAPGPKRIGQQVPTVSYTYANGEAEMAKQDAAKYCFENYGRAALVIDDVKSGDQRVMKFECVLE